LQRRNIDNHCLNSLTHHNHISKEYEKHHDELLHEIRSSINNNKKNKPSVGIKEDLQNYLEFLAFCLKGNLSFLQVSEIGKQLKIMSESNKLGFLKKYCFDREEIGKMTCSIGDALLNETIEDLKKNPFSLSIDNVTVSSTSICGIQVKYLNEYQDESGFKRSFIENKIVGLKYLEESSKSEVLLKTVKEKILNFGEDVKQNFIGITHDRASVFT